MTLNRLPQHVSGALETLRWSELHIDRNHRCYRCYRCCTNDQPGAFVHMTTCNSGDRVLKLTTTRHIRAWVDGALARQVMALVEQLRAAAVRPTKPREKVRTPKANRQTKATAAVRRGTV